jgi:diguanylate cyclase (GGDEF)-like protein/PAS domain S-box-containing protein
MRVSSQPSQTPTSEIPRIDDGPAEGVNAFVWTLDAELADELQVALGPVTAIQSTTFDREPAAVEAAILEHSARIGFIDLRAGDEASASLVQRLRDCGAALVCIIDPRDRDSLTTGRRQARQLGATEILPRDAIDATMLELVTSWALERYDLHRALEEAHARFSAAVQGTRDGFWEWDMRRDAIYFSRRWKEILGYEEADVGQDVSEWFDRVHPHDLHRVRADIEAHRRGTKPNHELEYRILAKDGTYRWVLSRGLMMTDATGRAIRMSGSLTDTTPLRQQVERIREEGRHDALTHLPRQDTLMRQLARSVELARDHRDYLFAVLLVEIHRFRLLQEGIGPTGTDTLLGQVAARLRRCVQSDDVLTRLDGPRFAVLLPGIEDEGVATHVSDRVLHALEEPFEIEGEQVYVSVNIGMTSSARGYRDPDDVLADVSAAAARATGRSPQRRSEMFATHMRVEAATMLRLEMALRTAVDREQFVLHYQPIVSIPGRKLSGFEALIRWQHPTRGLVPPGEFIPIAEETGMIVPMGRWALQTALRQLAQWHADTGNESLTMSVNLSGRQTDDPKLTQDILEAIEAAGVPASTLHLELTESELMENASVAAELLGGLRREGVKIYMDDFGTGYSSLSYLDRFPVDGLKIDRSFVDVLDGTADSATMVRTILSLAGNFNLDVVAEGIETDAQFAQLETLGCGLGQGYLMSRPVDSDRATELASVGHLA